jgi:hypothetical protein
MEKKLAVWKGANSVDSTAEHPAGRSDVWTVEKLVEQSDKQEAGKWAEKSVEWTAVLKVDRLVVQRVVRKDEELAEKLDNKLVALTDVNSVVLSAEHLVFSTVVQWAKKRVESSDELTVGL